MEKKKNTNVYLKAALTFLVLFVLPLGSVYFLTKGRDYRRDAIAELGDHGKVASFEAMNQRGLPISPETLRSKVAVVNFLSENREAAKDQADRIAMVHQSFDDTEDVLFLSFTLADSSVNLLDRAKALGITDHEQWFLLGASGDKLDWLQKEVFKLEKPDNGVALVDTSLTVRRHYDLSDNPAMGRLVEHISIVIPKQKRRGL